MAKILFVHPSVELYGADKILLYILGILSAKKHDITILLPKDGVLVSYIKNISSDIKIVTDERLPIAHSKLVFKDYISLPKKIRQIEKLFPKHSFDIVYCNTLATVLLLYTKWSKKRICHVHEIIENKLLNFAFSFLLRFRTKNVICVSCRVKNNLLFSKNYSVVHNGIPELAESDLQNKVSEVVQFALPGRFMPKKGQWFLIEALKLLPKEYLEKVHVSLYGSPPPNRMEYQDELKDAVKKVDLDSVVSIKTFTSDISQIYKTANVILVPSLMADPFPTTVLESLMFSRPVITTNNGGAVEILDETYAKIIAPNDAKAFASSLRFFVDNQEKIFEMGKNARNKYENYLTIKKFETRFFEFLQMEALC